MKKGPFLCLMVENRFKEKGKKRFVVTGKTFLLEEIEEKGLEIKGDMEFQGWTKFITMKEPIYPKLVRGFYVAATLNKESFAIESKIKRTEMVLIELYVYVDDALGMEAIDGGSYLGMNGMKTSLFRKKKLKMFCKGGS